jgi:hypothetical protein
MSKLSVTVALVVFAAFVWFIYDYNKETACKDTAIYVKCKNYFD